MGSFVVMALRNQEELLAGRGLLFAVTGLYSKATGLEVAPGPSAPCVLYVCSPQWREQGAVIIPIFCLMKLRLHPDG